MTEQNRSVEVSIAQSVAIRGNQLEMMELDDSTKQCFELHTRTVDVMNEQGVKIGERVASQSIRSRKAKEIAQLLGLQGKAHVDELKTARLIESDTIKHKITSAVVALDSDERFTGHSAVMSVPKSGLRVITFKLVEAVRPAKLQREIEALMKAYGKTETEILTMMRAQLSANAPQTEAPPIELKPDESTPEQKPEDTKPPVTAPTAPAPATTGKRSNK